jgi:glycosyltransferase involved in cell wall biosynthesis
MRRLRIAFVLLDSFFPSAHGGAHMIRVLAEGFARLGHDVHAVLMFEAVDDGAAQTVEKLHLAGIAPRIAPSGTIRFEHRGVRYSGVTRESERFLPFAVTELHDIGADAVILSDIGGPSAHLVLRVVHDRFDGRVIYFPMTVHLLPGGPLSVAGDPAAAALVKRCRVVAPSGYCVRYIMEHFAAAATACIPPMFDAGSFAAPDPASRFGRPVALFNPNAWKGLPVLLGLADARPDMRFVARCAWRTTLEDMRAIRARPNIVVHQQGPRDTATIYESASAVLVPSLCHESLGLVPIEAMLRGLPSLASDHAGLREAALGVPFLLPVNPIVFHRDPADPEARAREEIPSQPLAPWLDALEQLTSDKEFYAELSLRGWRAATDFARSLTWAGTAAAFLG